MGTENLGYIQTNTVKFWKMPSSLEIGVCVCTMCLYSQQSQSNMVCQLLILLIADGFIMCI